MPTSDFGIEENRKIELDLDQAQPVKPKKVEGAWGLYEEAVEAKETSGQDTLQFLGLDVARPEGTAELTSISGRLRNYDEEGNQVGGDSWISFSGGSSSGDAGIPSDVLRDGEVLSGLQGGDFSNLNRANQELLNQLEVGETGTIAFQPDWLNLENNQHVNSNDITDENGDLAKGIPIAEVTKIDEQLKRADDQEVRFSTSWQGTGTNELVLDSTPVNGADFAQKLNALISTEDNLGPFSWGNIRLRPTDETRENVNGRDIYLELKDIDDPDVAGRWTNNQQIGASNQPDEDSDTYTYEYSSTNSWNFKEIYSSLKEGESATWELERIHINAGNSMD